MLLSAHAVHISRSIVLHFVIVKGKLDVPRPRCVVPDKVLVAWWPLLLRVAREHALQTDADALHIVYGAPAGSVEKVEADDAVGVDMWVPRYGMCVVLDEDYFGSLVYSQLRVVTLQFKSRWARCVRYETSLEIAHLDRVVLAEHELESVRLAGVDRIRVNNLNVDKPSLEVVG